MGIVAFASECLRTGPERRRSSGAFLFPQIEDFGITAVEAQACGCPVIARNAGGALDSVIDQHTGILFNEPTAESMTDAIEKVPAGADTASACRTNAERFSAQVFRDSMLTIVMKMLKS